MYEYSHRLLHEYQQLLEWLDVCPDSKRNRKKKEQFILACCLCPNHITVQRLDRLGSFEMEILRTHVHAKVKRISKLVQEFEAFVGDDDELVEATKKAIIDIEELLRDIQNAEFVEVQSLIKSMVDNLDKYEKEMRVQGEGIITDDMWGSDE